MDAKEKDYRKLRFALALKISMEGFNKSKTPAIEGLEPKPKNISFRELEANSGIPHPAIVQIIHGKKNASWTTIDALLEGLDITLSKFAAVYDKITGKEIEEYKKEIEKKKQEQKKKFQKRASKSVTKKK
jgi:transcriptional regulator with XRE-family HTH domain